MRRQRGYSFLLALAMFAGSGQLAAAAEAEEQVFYLEAGELKIAIKSGSPVSGAPRFDLSARIADVTWQGRSYVGEPGLVDEFGLEGAGVLGYAEAPIGGGFIKIGVGVLQRDSESPYRFQHPYRWLKRFPVMAVRHENELEVAQRSETVYGYAYHYIKSYHVGRDGDVSIHYRLTNTGNRPFTVEHYNHNFFRLPNEEGASGCRLTTGFALHSPPPGWELASETEARWYGAAAVHPGVFWRMVTAATAQKNRVVLSLADGRQVETSGDAPLVRFAVWLEGEAISPETFSRHALAPGASADWIQNYCFSFSTPETTAMAAGAGERRGAEDKS